MRRPSNSSRARTDERQTGQDRSQSRPCRTCDEIAHASASPGSRGGSHHSSLAPPAQDETGEGVRAVTLLRRALRVCLPLPVNACPPICVDQKHHLSFARASSPSAHRFRSSFQSACVRLYARLANTPVTLLRRRYWARPISAPALDPFVVTRARSKRAFFDTSDASLSRLTRPNRILVPMHPGYCPNCGERVTPYAAGCALCGADLDPKRWQRPLSTGQRLSVRMPASLRRAITGRRDRARPT